MTSSKNRILLLSFIVFLMYFFGYSSNLKNKALKSERKYKALERKLKTRILEINSFNSYMIAYEKIKQQNKELSFSLKNGKDATEISRQIDEWSKIFNLKINKLSFETPYQNKKIYIIPISIEIEGEFFRIGDFFKAMETKFPNTDIELKNITVKKYPVLKTYFKVYIKELG